jgi:putative nucleotidyltransferase with HDIG domain
MISRTPAAGVTPAQVLLFSLALAFVLALILTPVLPGEASLGAGDVAFKTFRDGNEVIVEKGQVVSEQDIERIRGAGLLDNDFAFSDILSASIISVVSASMFGFYLYLFRPAEVTGVRRLVMLGIIIALWVAAARVFFSLTLPDSDGLYLGYMLPVAAAPMLVATLLDGGLAVLLAGMLALIATFAAYHLPDARNSAGSIESLQMVSALALSSLAGIFAVRNADRVNNYATAGLSVGIVTFLALFAFWLLLPGRDGVDVLMMLITSAVASIGTVIIMMGGSYVLGAAFGVATRIQLMELAQMTHPLLRELQEKAPGTFHHSVIVGNLAERAADLTGADSLLVRVGAYFHDIGKVAKPAYYIENQMGGENPHDRLDPDSSAKMVSEHVRAGLSLTARYRIPVRVRAFIPEHHGTRLVTYFYRKAALVDPAVDAESFRYPGPKPQSKETAIIMLADSVEAVVRASKDRSHEKIDQLVEGVINERVQEGQLDESDLTLRDLKTIGESFKATLRGIYHPRIEYPAPAAAEKGTAAAAMAYLHSPGEKAEAGRQPQLPFG